MLLTTIVPLWRGPLIRHGDILIVLRLVSRRLMHILSTWVSRIGAHVNDFIVLDRMTILIDVDRLRSTMILVTEARRRGLVVSVLNRHIATWCTACWWVEAVVWGGMIDTGISGIRRFILWYRTRLRRLLLIDTATLLLVASTLRPTHARATILTLRDIHISVVSGRLTDAKIRSKPRELFIYSSNEVSLQK